jgi:hypothetical protein
LKETPPTVSNLQILKIPSGFDADIDNTVTVTDLQSTNGTYIDGAELQPMKAVSGLDEVWGWPFVGL